MRVGASSNILWATANCCLFNCSLTGAAVGWDGVGVVGEGCGTDVAAVDEDIDDLG